MDFKKFKENAMTSAVNFGMVVDEGGLKGKNVVIRDTMKGRKSKTDDTETSSDNDKESNKIDYFGFIKQDQEPSGIYQGLSLVFFPIPKSEKAIMCIVVGTNGFQDDAIEASKPGTRRLFRQLLPHESSYAPFCKFDFLDIENTVKFGKEIENTKVKLDKYKKEMLIGCLIDLNKDWELAEAWIAQYAYFRKWPTNKDQRKAVAQSKNRILNKLPKIDYKKDVADLLKYNKFVVLQGAPGSGKTYLAEEIGKKYDKVFMTQFHAETTYSDFVESISPELDAETIKYKATKGTLAKAMEYAKENPEKNVLLIIDEINRANLANVLGPVFYLFEKNANYRTGEGIEISGKKYNSVPENMHVVATMNTADRSIAVVDFALRRRFAWYTVDPHLFLEPIQKAKDFFNNMQEIFTQYATDEEMNLMPGGSYFTSTTEEEFANTVKYGIMPLIREYLDQGLLSSAKNEFVDLFYTDYNLHLYE